MNELPNRDVVIFTEAVDLPADERAAYLERACGGDAELRQRVESLLQTDDHVGDFLELASQKTAILARVGGSTSEKPGDRIGRYKLLQEIGEGGCGVVYMAEQEEPVRRRVALKIIKLGMDTKSVIARFEAERQALALMDHPNIAKVFDAGATESGRPYFVMQLIRGDKITEYCDQHSLTTQERLKLFIQVCQAIQHAHQKGIIHRDIKPSNILVTTTLEGGALPVVIDFGIAKATTNQPLTDKTLFTAFEMLIGTPAYMSPEQAARTSVDVDTRSDIYSLGVLLYELLTSATPFEVGELLKKGLDEIRRVIRDQEPVRPSTRLSKMTDADVTTVAQHRKSEPPTLISTVRGDLDWIAMKALEKDRTRRYETANGLALDVQRFLSGEVVSARPPSVAYKFQKLALRNKLLFICVSVIAVLLVTSLIAVSASLAKERQARRQADAALRLAEEEKAKAQTEAVKSQQVTQFLEKMLQGVGPSVARGRDTAMLREVLDATSERLGPELSKQPTIEAELRGVVGRVYRELGLYSEAENEHRTAVGILRTQNPGVSPELASALNDLGLALSRRGNNSEAEATFREALALRRQFYGNEHLMVAATLHDLAGALFYQRKTVEAETLVRQSLDMRRRILGGEHLDVADSLNAWGVILDERHDYSNATAVARQVVEIRRKLLPKDHPLIADSIFTLSHSLNDEGKLTEAESLAREALAIKLKILGDEHPDVAHCQWLLGTLLMRQDKPAEAEAELRASLQIQRKLPGRDQYMLAWTSYELAEVLEMQGKHAEAEKSGRDALGEFRKFEDKPNDHAVSLLDFLAKVLSQMDRKTEAEIMYREALAMQTTLSGNEYANVADPLNGLIEILLSQSKMGEAEQILTDGLAANQDNPTNRAYFLLKRAECLARQGRWREAAHDAKIAVESVPSEHYYYHTLAPLLVACEDWNAYSSLSQTIVARFGDTTNVNVADRMAKDCLIAALPGLDLEAVGGLASLAVTKGTNDMSLPFFQACEAMAEYREGNYQDATVWAKKSLENAFPYSRAEAFSVLAMAYNRLDESDAARNALTSGRAVLFHEMPQLEGGDLGINWRDWIIAHALLTEAQNLLSASSTKPNSANPIDK